jgi:hypothetical protein
MSEPAYGRTRPDDIKKEKVQKEFCNFLNIAGVDKYFIIFTVYRRFVLLSLIAYRRCNHIAIYFTNVSSFLKIKSFTMKSALLLGMTSCGLFDRNKCFTKSSASHASTRLYCRTPSKTPILTSTNGRISDLLLTHIWAENRVENQNNTKRKT